MPDRDRTEEALARLREARQTFADIMVAGSNIAPRDLNRARVVRADSFDALIAVVEAAERALDECDLLERGEAWWSKLRAAQASLSAAVLGEEG